MTYRIVQLGEQGGHRRGGTTLSTHPTLIGAYREWPLWMECTQSTPSAYLAVVDDTGRPVAPPPQRA